MRWRRIGERSRETSKEGGRGGGECGESGRRRREGKKGGKRKKNIYKIAFWNVAGLRNKDKEFWQGLREWDVMMLSETWVDRKGWEKVRNRLPKGYSWEVQWAGRKSRKGRAMGENGGGSERENKDR